MADDVTVQVGVDTSKYDAGMKKVELTALQVAKATMSYNRQLDSLEKAFKKGRLTVEQYSGASEELLRSFNLLKTQGAAAAAVMNQFGIQATRAQSQMKRFGSVGLQQVGYQVQDFAVQVQSGTNAFVALGQQGSQLLGILGPMGAVAGAALAIGTAIARVYFETDKAAKASKKLGDDFSKAFDNLDEALEGTNIRLERFASLIDSLEVSKVKDALEDLAETAEKSFDPNFIEKALAFIEKLPTDILTLGVTLPFTASVKWDQAQLEQAAAGFNEAFGLELSKGFSGDFVKDFFSEWDRAIENLDISALEEGLSFLESVSQNATREGRALTEEYARTLEFVRDLVWATNLVGEEGQGAVRAAMALAKENGKAYVEALKLQGVDLETGVDAAKERMKELADEAERAAKAASDFTDSLTTVTPQSIAGLQAKLKVLEAGGTEGQAEAAGFQAEAEAGPQFAEEIKRASGSGDWSRVIANDELVQSNKERIILQAELNERIKALTSSQTKSTKSTDSMVASYEKLMDRLNGVSSEQQKYNNDLRNLDKWLAAGAISVEQYRAAVALLKEELAEAQDPLRDFKKQLEDALNPDTQQLKGMQAIKGALDEFLFNPFEVGLEGMVYSFAVALQRMAAEALSAKLMQSLMGMGFDGSIFSSFLGSANGNVFSRGDVVPYANGGIVTSPVAFPMMGGRTGIMGEAGPEAIMPLTRKNGKLGVEATQAPMAAPETNIKVINIDDRASIGEYLAGPAGEKIVMNVLRRNGFA